MTTEQVMPFTTDQTWLECIGCGHRADLLTERKFVCPQCNNLYDVRHALPGRTVVFPVASSSMFDQRARPSATSPLDNSGVWRFRELVMPFLPDKHIVTRGEGNIPIVPAGRHLRKWIGGDLDIWLMLEGLNPSGSFKDCGMTAQTSVAKSADVRMMASASTGDTSASLAMYAAAADIPCAVLLPRGRITPVQLTQPLAHGAIVITVPTDFDGVMRIMRELVEHHGVYPANSLNPVRIEGHQATAFLIAQFFGWRLPHWIAAPVGNGSNVSSIGKGMRCLRDLHLVEGESARILGCQSEAASPLTSSLWEVVRAKAPVTRESWEAAYRPTKVGETTATAACIGNPVSYRKVIREVILSNGWMEIASEKDLNEAVMVAGKDGFLVCPQTGMALAGVRNALHSGTIKCGQRVVVVSTATGLKFMDSIAECCERDIIAAPDCNTDTIAKLLKI